MAPAPEPEVLAEALRLAREGEEAGVPLRLVGGVAVHAHARAGVHPAFARELNDIDLAVPKAADRSGPEFLESMGYEAERTFNAMNAGRRAMFWDTERDRKVDLFVGSLEMCHVVPLTGRIEADAPTIPLAELLLTKLQIVHLNEKDVRDTLAVLVEHEVGAVDEETINADEIARLCAADWGLWRTVKLNIERMGAAVADYPVSADEAECIAWRLDELWTRVEAEPKSRRWRARSKVGDRKRWYEEPEEVG